MPRMSSDDSGLPGSTSRRTTRVSRRRYLAALGTSVFAGLAGCGKSSAGISSEEVNASGAADGWGPPVRLTPADDGTRNFGTSVALSGDGTTGLASSTYHVDESKAGPTYVIDRSDGDWQRRATLTPDDGPPEMHFGWDGESTALSDDGTTAVVGAVHADDNGPRSGKAYVFERSDGSWGRPASLFADDGARKDFFGTSVAVSSDGLRSIVGAWGADHDGGSGAVYVFEPTDGGWSQVATVTPDGGPAAAGFGRSVALSADGTRTIIGSGTADSSDGGSAYVFDGDGGTWRQRTRLVPTDGGPADFFGGSIALQADTVIVGAPQDDNPNGERAGSASVFRRDGGAWRHQATLVPDDGDGVDLFGTAVALTGDGATALVGARVDEDPNGEKGGSAYAFERSDGAWSQQAKLAPDDGEPNEVFGRSVALSAEAALIGTLSGAAYVY